MHLLYIPQRIINSGPTLPHPDTLIHYPIQMLFWSKYASSYIFSNTLGLMTERLDGKPQISEGRGSGVESQQKKPHDLELDNLKK